MTFAAAREKCAARFDRTAVERQAREFELLKPYLVERWEAAGGTDGGAETAAADEAEATEPALAKAETRS